MARPTTEGAGVHLRRALGSQAMPLVDPFLLLDEMHSSDPADYVAGFPRHPHRGFETVTYVIHGAVEHRDSVGNKGRLVDGAAQWMTAGHGIIHSEMPRQTSGELWALQLWVNLPAKKKLIAPRYQDIAPETIPELDVGDARVRLVAGDVDGKTGAVDGIAVAPTMMDVSLPAGGKFRHVLPAGHAAFFYVLDGVANVGPEARAVNAGEIAVLGDGDAAACSTASGARMLLIAGAPIGEPVARRGPFVMNTEAELDQAYEDYRSGRLTET
jgi:redox-sensitive bicupin YhaK (pirin superfamily)